MKVISLSVSLRVFVVVSGLYSFLSCSANQVASIKGADGATQKREPFMTQLCVQTFNAYGPAYSTDIAGRTLEFANELGRDPCDIIQLQEVWKASHYDRVQEDLRNALPKASGVRFDNTQSPYLGKSGLATFTQHNLTRTSFSMFKVNIESILDNVRSQLGVIKGLGFSDVTVGGSEHNATVQMVNLHTHPMDTGIRIAQMTQLLTELEQRDDARSPVIITGDFNFRPDSVEYNLLRDVGLFTDSYRETHNGYQDGVCTYCSTNPHYWGGGDRVIDFIWLRSGSDLKLRPTGSAINMLGSGSVIPSDHFGLRTVFEVRSENSMQIFSQEDYLNRVNKADAAIDEALNYLKTSGQLDKADFAETVQKLNELRARLQNPSSEDPIVRLFMR